MLMRPRDWFSVGVRLFGLYVFFRGFTDLLLGVGYALKLLPQSNFRDLTDTPRAETYYLWYAAGYLALAIYFIFGAEHLTKWAFKELAESETDPEDSSEI
jgi:hypothetical protein